MFVSIFILELGIEYVESSTLLSISKSKFEVKTVDGSVFLYSRVLNITRLKISF